MQQFFSDNADKIKVEIRESISFSFFLKTRNGESSPRYMRYYNIPVFWDILRQNYKNDELPEFTEFSEVYIMLPKFLCFMVNRPSMSGTLNYCVADFTYKNLTPSELINQFKDESYFIDDDVSESIIPIDFLMRHLNIELKIISPYMLEYFESNRIDAPLVKVRVNEKKIKNFNMSLFAPTVFNSYAFQNGLSKVDKKAYYEEVMKFTKLTKPIVKDIAMEAVKNAFHELAMTGVIRFYHL